MRRNDRLGIVLVFALALLLATAPLVGRARTPADVTPATALELADQAKAKMDAKDWSGAAALWQRAVELNPVVGTYWSGLARARYRAREYQKAIAAYQQALTLRASFPSVPAYRIACCYARLGDNGQAFLWLEKSFALGLRNLDDARTEDDLKSLHSDPRFRKLVALVDVNKMTRSQGWRYDIELLVRELRRLHYELSKKPAPKGFDALAQRLRDEVPKLTDHQLEVGLMKLVRLAGDAHAQIEPAYFMPPHRKALPVQLYLFQEGLFVISAAPTHKEIVGAEVVRFGPHSVKKVQAALDPLISRDNEMWLKLMEPRFMCQPQLLNGLGLIKEDDRVALRLRDKDGNDHPLTLVASEAEPDANWVSAADETPGPEPLYLKNRQAPYWFEYLADSGVVYFQFNEVRNDDKEPLDKSCRRLFEFIAGHRVEKLAIDIRWNAGGNLLLNDPLVHGLIRCDTVNKRGKLFVIIGRNTASAAQCLAAQIERNASVIFVGEPTGSSPNFVGETCPLFLPYSKMAATISDLYWQNSVAMDYRTWIAPELYTPPTFAAYRAKRDTALEAILGFSVKKEDGTINQLGG
jgi:tetratricopeptide (TPR) repeat protein